MKWNLIYIDDQIQNLEVYKELLEPEFNVSGCQDARLVESLLEHESPHAIMLDVHMPLMDGYTLFQKIVSHRAYNGCPIFFISGDVSIENKILSYQKGGVDFISRDLRSEEVMIRLRNKIKFHLQTATKLQSQNLRINVEDLTVTINHEMVDLTLLEFRILSMLLRNFPFPLARQEVIKKIWGNEAVKPGTVNTHITNLKNKISGWSRTIRVRDDHIFIQDPDQ